MGDKVRCGTFIFTVLEVEYKSQLGDSAVAKRPQNGQFICLRVQATNAGGTNANVPTMRLENDKGDLIPEVEDARDLAGWFGVFRKVEPGQSESGWIAFDAPAAEYGLMLTDGKLEDESTGTVRIPVQYPRS